MTTLTVYGLILVVMLMRESYARPDQHRVHHRIHVPTKVKTIYHTKFIKVPEHHHYIHEKEKPKLIKIPEHHHYFHEKEKEKLVDLSHLHKVQEDTEHQDYDSGLNHYDFGSINHHNIFKKHAPHRQYRKHTKH